VNFFTTRLAPTSELVTFSVLNAGLASVMIALVFLYTLASIFVFGGELNASICRAVAAEKAEKERAEND